MKENTILFKVSKFQLTTGIILGIAYAIIFFNFLLVCIKGIILIDASIKDYELFYLNNNENIFYLFLYGFISVFFSYSIVINYWLNKPNKIFSKKNYKRKSIENQQRLTNWFFMSWFSRMGLFLGFVTMDFKEYSFYNTYKYLIFLFIIVFIGQIWMSLRFFFLKNKFKWFLKIFTSILVLSLCISKINFSKANAVEKAILQKNILKKHNIKIITSENFTERIYTHLDYEVFLTFVNGTPKLISNGFEIAIDDKNIEESLIDHFELKKGYNNQKNYKKCILYIDKNMPMKHVYTFKQYLTKIGVYKIRYSVHKKETIPFYYKSNYVFSYRITDELSKKEIKPYKNIIIKIFNENHFSINDELVLKENLINKLDSYYRKEKIYHIVLVYNEAITFKEYFTIMSTTKSVTDKIKNEYTMKSYGKDYKQLDQKRKIRNEYSWTFTDSIEK